MKRYKLIACGVLKKELDSIRDSIPDEIDLDEVWLEQGLHREPDRLNRLVIDEIARTETNSEPLDAILLGYGICSRGTVGVSSSRYRIVIPRAHDCITLFLGSKERYLDEFSKAPGTYWFTPGFISGRMQPGMSEKYAGIYHQFEDNFEQYLERFGDEDSARYVIDHQEQAWIRNYSRGAYVEGGLPGGDALREKAKAFCAARNWLFEEIRGDFSLIRDLVSGAWDTGRFLVLEPGQTLAIGGIDDIITARGTDDRSIVFGDNYEKSYRFDGAYLEIDASESQNFETVDSRTGTDRVIGIDAGGTYTDAVVVSLREHTVLAAAKAPTTYHDLSVGIREALLKLPEKLRGSASRIALSTTLATNAIVEEKGGRTGLVLIGYDEDVASRVTIGARDLKTVVPGRHDIYGIEVTPLDERGLLTEAQAMFRRGIEAFAVSSYMGTRNPDHEIRAVSLLSEAFDIPVVSGHELTDDIDSVRRAMTTLLNARLLPVITELVDSVVRVAAEMELPDDIRFVTTDGSLMNTLEAKKVPVRMVLSGPAASVAGVRYLTDIASCVLVDMGGTTTDIAVIEDGSARRSGRGAVVGRYRTSIQATDIKTLGLGGDSRIAWERGRIAVGPQRIIPISILAAEHSHVCERLKSLKGYEKSDYALVQPGIFYGIRRLPDNDSFLNDRERRIVYLLERGPLSVVDLAEQLDYPYLSLLGIERLEELGIVLASGLTPTDVLADGQMSEHYYEHLGIEPSTEAARIMLDLYSGRTGMTDGELIDCIRTEIHRLASSAIIHEAFSVDGDDFLPLWQRRSAGDYSTRDRFSKGTDQSSTIEVRYRLKHPLVGIGAPTAHMLDGMDRFLLADKVYPQWGEVANAVGAASGAGGVHIDMNIVPDGKGRHLLFSPDGQFIFRSLDDAKAKALDLARDHALTYARNMGYQTFRLDVRVRDRSAPTAFGSEIYIDTAVVAKMRY